MDCTVAPKYVGVLINYILVYVMCVFGWFNKRNKLLEYSYKHR